MATKNDLEKKITSMLSKLPGVEVLPKLGHVSFLVGKKVFAFTRPGAIVLKLPAPRIAELVGSERAQVLVMGKRKMKEWAVIAYEGSGSPAKDLAVFKESLSFVASL